MSFSANPYRCMTMRTNEDGTYSWRCDSCGAESKKHFVLEARLLDIRANYDEHLKKSHVLRPEDTATWSDC